MEQQRERLLVVAALLLVALLALSACTAAVPQAPAAGEPAAEAPAVEGATLSAYTVVVGGKDPEEHELFQQEIKRLTGLEINMVKPPGSEYDQKLVTALAAGEVIDLMYMTTPSFERLHAEGLFAPLTQCIENSPILSDPEVIDPAEWERIRRDDGEIYAVFNKDEGGLLPIARCDWIEKLGIDAPQNLDDYRALFEAFASQDPDGNGQDDTYGLTLAGIYDIQPFMGVYGLKYGYVQGGDGCWDIPWASEEAIPVYEWLHQLYADGLLDPNFATNNTAAARELIFSDRAGMMVYWAAWVGLFNEQVRAENPDTEFTMCGLEPPKGENGQALLRAGDDGLWTVHVDSQNMAAACQFLEFYHSPEGNILSTLGIEGHDYTVTDGNYELTEVGASHAMDHGAPYPKSLKWENPVGTPLNVPEASAIVRQYGQLQTVRETTQPAMDIVSQYGVKAILGELTAADAVAQMQQELQAKEYVSCQ
ncbi:MAG: extracellular solute-binding protein [Caldilineaceae bacterium]|nr:extracellular solute-binding protein [Caldilineaceae bacterium]